MNFFLLKRDRFKVIEKTGLPAVALAKVGGEGGIRTLGTD